MAPPNLTSVANRWKVKWLALAEWLLKRTWVLNGGRRFFIELYALVYRSQITGIAIVMQWKTSKAQNFGPAGSSPVNSTNFNYLR